MTDASSGKALDALALNELVPWPQLGGTRGVHCPCQKSLGEEPFHHSHPGALERPDAVMGVPDRSSGVAPPATTTTPGHPRRPRCPDLESHNDGHARRPRCLVPAPHDRPPPAPSPPGSRIGPRPRRPALVTRPGGSADAPIGSVRQSRTPPRTQGKKARRQLRIP